MEADGGADMHGLDVSTRMWLRGERSVALELAFRTAQPSMLLIARRVAGGDASDIVQEAVLRVWNHPDRFDAGRGSLARYLITTTRGTALDHVRRTERRRDRERRSVAGVALTTSSETVDLDLLHGLRRALQALEHDDRRLINHAFFDEFTYRHLADHLGLPEGTVKSRMRRTLRRLREDLRPLNSDVG